MSVQYNLYKTGKSFIKNYLPYTSFGLSYKTRVVSLSSSFRSIVNIFFSLKSHFMHRRSWHGITLPPIFNFLFTYLFSIKFLYFFNISSRFPYFNLFVSIFIQSFVNSNLHVSILYILIIHKARYSETFKIVHLLASVTFNAPYSHYIIQSRICINS